MMTKAVSQMLRRLRWTDRFVSTTRILTPSIERRRPWEARSRTISLSARAADIASAPSLSCAAIETISSVNAACTSSCACNLWHVAHALKRFLCSLRLQNKRRPPALSISSEQEGMKAQKSTQIRANLGVLSCPLNALEHVARACRVPLSLNRTHDNEWFECVRVPIRRFERWHLPGNCFSFASVWWCTAVSPNTGDAVHKTTKPTKCGRRSRYQRYFGQYCYCYYNT
jgi:hypothetical protein